MLKGREIALTLRSSWIMNAVSINVCIINHISTNWTSVEPAVLSDMETGLDYCLCYRIKDSRMMCSFLCGCATQVEWAIAAALWPFSSLYKKRGGGRLFLVWMDKYLLNFTQEGEKNEEEIQAGSCVVFTDQFHCVSEKLLFRLFQQYWTLVVRNTRVPMIAF